MLVDLSPLPLPLLLPLPLSPAPLLPLPLLFPLGIHWTPLPAPLADSSHDIVAVQALRQHLERRVWGMGCYGRQCGDSLGKGLLARNALLLVL